MANDYKTQTTIDYDSATINRLCQRPSIDYRATLERLSTIDYGDYGDYQTTIDYNSRKATSGLPDLRAAWSDGITSRKVTQFANMMIGRYYKS